jgi:hypothetical protein
MELGGCFAYRLVKESVIRCESGERLEGLHLYVLVNKHT